MEQNNSNHTVRAWVVCVVASLFFMDEFMRINMFNALRDDMMQAFNMSGAAYGQFSALLFLWKYFIFIPCWPVVRSIFCASYINNYDGYVCIGEFSNGLFPPVGLWQRLLDYSLE